MSSLSSNPLLDLIASGEMSIAGSRDTVLRDLEALSSALGQVSYSVSSASIPFRQMREFIRRIISLVSSDATVVASAATLYLQLVSKVSHAYDEHMLSSCTQHFSHILKEAVGFKCTSNCDSRRMVCTESNHISLTLFKVFLREFVTLMGSKMDDFYSHGFISVAMHYFGNLIRYARGSWSHDSVLKGVDTILKGSDMRERSTIYKVLLPIVRLSLPSQNQATLIGVVVHIAANERDFLRLPSKSRNSYSDSVSEVQEGGIIEIEGTDQANCRNDAISQRLSVIRFLEVCCIHVPDRADQRATLCSLFIRVLHILRKREVHDFGSFVLKASRHPKGLVRLFAVEVATIFVSRCRDLNSTCLHDRTAMLKMLSDRVNDRIPSVRVKAIASLTEALKDQDPESEAAALDELVGIAFSLIERLCDAKSRVRKSVVDFIGLACKQILGTRTKNWFEKGTVGTLDSSDGHDFPFLSDKSLIDLVTHLKSRGTDGVSNVRMATLFQITRIIRNLSECMEPLLVRKLLRLWCDVVLPHSNDVDSRCRDICLKSVHAVLLSGHEDTSSWFDGEWEASSYSLQHVTGLFLSEVGSGRQHVAELVKQSVRAMSKKGIFGNREIDFVCKRALLSAGTKELLNTRRGAWIVLAEISNVGSAKLVKKGLRLETIRREVLSFSNRSACRIAADLADTMTTHFRKELAVSLETTLFTEHILNEKDTDSIVAGVGVLSVLQENAGSDLINRAVRLVSDVKAEVEDKRNENILCLIGSICLFFRLGKEPPQSVLNFVRALASNSTKSSKLRALALTTLGKICLSQGQSRNSGGILIAHEHGGERNAQAFNSIGETLTRRHISIFVHELENATSSATKNNAVIVLCDLCRLYTAVVEPYIPRLAELLCDPSDFVRVQVLSSVLSLLQEDYIKLRSGPVFFQIAKCLLDPSKTVRETAEYGLLRVATPKNSSILATSFIELIFVLNECTECPTYNQSALGERRTSRSRSRFSDGFEDRRRVYEVFLQGMNFEHRLRLPGRFRSDVLSPIVDGKLALNSPSLKSVLTDTLNLFAYLQLCFSADRKRSEEDANDEQSQIEGLDTSNSRQKTLVDKIQVARGLNLVNKVQLLELRESTIPVLLELRHHLEELRSPILKVLMRSLCTLLQPHRRNLENLIPDHVVRSEIQHEMSAMVRNMCPEEQMSEKPIEAHEKRGRVPARYESGPNEGAETIDTPAKLLSVPRTRPAQSTRKTSVSHSDSDDDSIMLECVEKGPGRQLSRRIERSPKLAAIASRTNLERSKSAFKIDVDEKPSGFALALARIEDAAKA